MTHDPYSTGSRDPTTGWTADRSSGQTPPSGVGTHGHKGGDLDSGSVTVRELAAAVISTLLPVGIINAYYGTAAPTGWLLCDGSTFSSTTYPALAALLGGTTLPNLKGKVIVGVNAAETEWDVLGETGGAKTVTIGTTHLPVHTHTLNGHTHGGAGNTSINHQHTAANHNHGGGTGVHGHTVSAGLGGGNVGLTGGASNYNLLEQTKNTNSVGQANTFEAPVTDFIDVVHGHNIPAANGDTSNGGFPNTALGIIQPYMAVTYIIKAA